MILLWKRGRVRVEGSHQGTLARAILGALRALSDRPWRGRIQLLKCYHTRHKWLLKKKPVSRADGGGKRLEQGQVPLQPLGSSIPPKSSPTRVVA